MHSGPLPLLFPCLRHVRLLPPPMSDQHNQTSTGTTRPTQAQPDQHQHNQSTTNTTRPTPVQHHPNQSHTSPTGLTPAQLVTPVQHHLAQHHLALVWDQQGHAVSTFTEHSGWGNRAAFPNIPEYLDDLPLVALLIRSGYYTDKSPR